MHAGGCGRPEIVRDRAYFKLYINELFLAEGRNWWATYDPVVLVITEFVYDKGRISVPMIVGPNMIQQKMGSLPHGVVLHDTRVAGPYPFRGGPVAVTVILYKVKHHDYARSLLRFVESVSSAVGVPADLDADQGGRRDPRRLRDAAGFRRHGPGRRTPDRRSKHHHAPASFRPSRR